LRKRDLRVGSAKAGGAGRFRRDDAKEGEPGLKIAAGDPAMTAELLMLFRLILADGEAGERELATLRRICRDSFEIEEAAFPAMMDFVERMEGGTRGPRLVAVFRGFDRPRRIALARRMMAVALADGELRRHQDRLLVRVLDILDLTPADIGGDAG
jgi:uncharacterized tellurite resistance protein B-like protein